MPDSATMGVTDIETIIAAIRGLGEISNGAAAKYFGYTLFSLLLLSIMLLHWLLLVEKVIIPLRLPSSAGVLLGVGVLLFLSASDTQITSHLIGFIIYALFITLLVFSLVSGRIGTARLRLLWVACNAAFLLRPFLFIESLEYSEVISIVFRRGS